MFPLFTFRNSTNLRFSDSESSRNNSAKSISVVHPDPSDIDIRKFCASVRFPKLEALFIHSIMNISAIISNPKMFWVDARRIIAGVAYNRPNGNSTFVNFIRNSVRTSIPAKFSVPIAIVRSFINPARISSSGFAEENAAPIKKTRFTEFFRRFRSWFFASGTNFVVTRHRYFLYTGAIILAFLKPISLHAANGTVLLIDKLAPKNAAFIGLVDSSQTVTNTTNFNNNLSSSDDTVQKALDTLDEMVASGGGGGGAPTAGSTNYVWISTGYVQPGAFKISSGTVYGPLYVNDDGGGNAALILNGSLTVDRPDLGTGLVSRSALSFLPNASTPRLSITAYNAIASESAIAFYDANVNQYAALKTNPLSVHSISLALSSGATSAFSPTIRWGATASGKQNFYGPNTDSIVEFDPIGNSSFTIPVYLSSITINKQIIDSVGSAGTTDQVLTKKATGPTWADATGGGGGSGTPLEVFSNFDVQRTSPTRSISIGDALKMTVSGSTAIVTVDFSSVASRGDLSGYLPTTTLYVASANVTGALTITGNGTVGSTPTWGVNFSSVQSVGMFVSSFPATGVTPGSYTNTSLTVDAYGRLTAASNGAGGSAASSGVSGSVQIASNSVLGSVTGFVYSTTTAVLTIPGVVITSGTTSGMSSIQRGLTVNTSGYNTVGSSSSFIVNGGGVGSVVPRFTVDPINDIVISSAQAKFVSSTTFNGAVIDGAATAGTSGQVFTSRGNGLSPTWQAPAVSQSDLTAYMTQSSSTANNLKLSSATATYLNKQSIYVASATVTSAFSLSGTNNVAAAAPIFALNSSSVTMYGPNIPAASISAGSLGASVLVSSLTAVNTNVGSFTNANITVNAQGQVTAASNGSAGGGSGTPVAVSSNSVIVSSPTTNINFMPPFIVSLQGATTSLVTLNSSSVTLQGVLNDIHNQNQLQQGASFYVWNGTVDGMLTVYGSSGTDGMSTFDRGLTVNVGQYSTSTSSADFKVKGPNADMFSVAPSSGFIVMAATTVINGGWAWKTRTVTTSTTATVDDNFIGVSDTSAPRTITLFSTATCTSTNYKLTVMDQSGGAASNNITLATTGGQKINGSTTKVISTNYQALDAICKSDGWWAW